MRTRFLLKILLISVIVFHFILLIGNVLAFLWIPYLFFTGQLPFYIASPLFSLLGNMMFTGNTCALTKAEDKIRKVLGMKEIRLFIRHYIINPILK